MRSFKMLKDRITSTLVLTLLEFTKVSLLYFDTSRVDSRCVLVKHEIL